MRSTSSAAATARMTSMTFGHPLTGVSPGAKLRQRRDTPHGQRIVQRCWVVPYYVIAGSVSGIGADDDIWRSTNLGSTWVNVHAGP